MAYLSTTPTPPLTWEIPGAVKTLLSTVRMAALLYGSGRVYVQEDAPAEPEEREKKPWGRVVVMLADRLAPFQEPAGRERVVRILVKAEVNDPGGDFNVTRALEAIQLEAFNALEGKTVTVTKAGVRFPVWRVGLVNLRPVWDEEHGTWVLTSEFRTVLKPA